MRGRKNLVIKRYKPALISAAVRARGLCYENNEDTARLPK